MPQGLQESVQIADLLGRLGNCHGHPSPTDVSMAGIYSHWLRLQIAKHAHQTQQEAANVVDVIDRKAA